MPKMRDIYMKAEVTLSWIGPEAHGSAEAFRYALDLYKLHRKHMAKQKLFILPAEEEKEVIKTKVKFGDPALEALLQLVDRPYFERAWVVQEIVVSPQVIFVCGESYMAWATLLGAFLYLSEVHPWVFEFYAGLRMRYVLEMRLSEMDWESQKDVQWQRTLLRHRGFQSGNGRDKIFAYYGLRCKQALDDLCIEVDYHKSTVDVYTDLAARALKQKHVMVLHVPRLVLSEIQEKDPEFENLTLPSWVPDWRWTDITPNSLVNVEGYTVEHSNDYAATKESQFSPRFDAEPWNTFGNIKDCPTDLPKLIGLRGFTVGRVTRLTHRRWEHFQLPHGAQTIFDQARLLQYTQQQVHEWEAVFHPSNTAKLNVHSEPGEPSTEAMYETFMAGTSLVPKEEKRVATRNFERRQRILRVVHTLGLQDYLFFYLAMIFIERVLRLFGYQNPEMRFRFMVMPMGDRRGAHVMTGNQGQPEKTHFALVPSICKLDDVAVLVQGVKTPLILRPNGEGNVEVMKKTVPMWELIGDAYVHGMMTGNMWDSGREDHEEYWIA